MATKPSSLPTWATDGGTTLEPSAGKKAEGFSAGKKLPRKWINWILNLIYQWVAYVSDGVFTTATTNTTCVTATGNGTGHGISGTGGTTNASGTRSGSGGYFKGGQGYSDRATGGRADHFYGGVGVIAECASDPTWSYWANGAIRLVPTTLTLSVDAQEGELAVKSGKLYIYTGSAWVVVGTQT